MSNVMSLKHVKNHVHRSAFDLSFRNAFTAKVGELLPVMTKEVIPGDKFKLGVESFTRTMPVNSAAYTRIKEYYDFFFVPNRLLWRYFDSYITDMSQINPQFADSIVKASSETKVHPLMIRGQIESYLNALAKLTSKSSNANFAKGLNCVAKNRIGCTTKLLEYLGYGSFYANPIDPNKPLVSDKEEFNGSFGSDNSLNTFVNPFPLLAYQKIYNDYYRNTQWQKGMPQNYNIDYVSVSQAQMVVPISDLTSDISTGKFSSGQSNMFDLQYCDWNKDLFMGILPSAQFGDTATVDVDNVIHNSFQLENINGNLVSEISSKSSDGSQIVRVKTKNSNTPVVTSRLNVGINSSNPFFASSSFSVLALRQAECLQKWREITQSTNTDYKHQIESHFGVSVPDVRSNLCTWIGGSSSNITINEVVNTNLDSINSSDGTQAYIAGKGLGMLNGREEFDVKEHGIIMCIYHAVPLCDYSLDALDPLVCKTNYADYAIPEFDQIGNQPLNRFYFSNQKLNTVGSDPITSHQYTMGYVPRYVDYKTSIDVVKGAFRDSLSYWVAPITSKYGDFGSDPNFNITWNFFKVNPSILDSIFAVNATSDVNTDNLLVNAFFDVKAVRNLDYAGLPY